jgi:prophage DNA circulation protein
MTTNQRTTASNGLASARLKLSCADFAINALNEEADEIEIRADSAAWERRAALAGQAEEYRNAAADLEDALCKLEDAIEAARKLLR